MSPNPPSAVVLECIADAAAAAATWWAARLRDAVGVGDNGDDGYASVAACFMTRMIRQRNPPTEENCARFERELAQRLVDILANPGRARGWYFDGQGWDDGGIDIPLSVDYHPCPILREALAAAGVDRIVSESAALPLKTNMRVSARRVMVAHGYGARWREIHGPAWGSTRAEHEVVEAARGAARTAMYDAWDEQGRPGDPPRCWEWQGPVRG